ncbi:MAG: hypothetical protein AAF629_20555 [Chloroflexota bacterium]
MPQSNRPKLDMGDRFPLLTISLADGKSIKLPDDLQAPQTILLLYRGKW